MLFGVADIEKFTTNNYQHLVGICNSDLTDFI